MPALPTNLRRDLERTVIKARDVAEAGARQALEAITVHETKPGGHLDAAGRALRNRLRAHARQLGDRRDTKTDRQAIDRLTHECAYEHWHRMLFARFLAENDLLLEPESGVSLNLDLARDLARETKRDVWEMISRFATDTLPQIFRPDDPVLAVQLAPEIRSELEGFLEGLPRETFLAEDSLGWVYQFWQSKRKDEVNASGEKITGDTIAAVTQLFTEHYMVLFLLHNTLGAWHAGKILAARPELAESATSEQELRDAVAVRTDTGDIEWTYLRFVRDTEDGPWRPAAGVFEGWPRDAKDLKILDPCCGSGHFLVAGLQILARLRMHEQGLSVEDAVCAVVHDNLYGLEIDQRCVQLAAFNVALAAWTLAGRRIELPDLHIACSGIGPSASEAEWIRLAEESGKPMPQLGAEPIRDGLRNLHALFTKAPTLGSLIDPNQLPADLITADYETLKPYLDAALSIERVGDDVRERVIAAAGMVKAAELLAGEYALIITNVPYLGRGKQDSVLMHHLEKHFASAKADLATAFVKRCMDFTETGGTVGLVTPQNWLFLTSYKKLRENLLREREWNLAARLGPGAFDTISGHVVNVALLTISRPSAANAHRTACLDVSGGSSAGEKCALLRGEPAAINLIPQSEQLKNPDARVAFSTQELAGCNRLGNFVTLHEGMSRGDVDRFDRCFWELGELDDAVWSRFINSPSATESYTGRELVIRWDGGEGDLAKSDGARITGYKAWGQEAVFVARTSDLKATLTDGAMHAQNGAVLLPNDGAITPALWAYCEDESFCRNIRLLDKKIIVASGSFMAAPFDLSHWQKVAAEKYPHGLPAPESDDPSQWLFHGRPDASEEPLQVAVARLTGYRWPAEHDVDMRLSVRGRALASRCDELLGYADDDGILCIDPVRGEQGAEDRLRRLLSAAVGSEWSAAKEADLLAAAGSPGLSLDEWLRTAFFQQHCDVFHQRPFVWHIWDGKKDGFHALVNYHKLVAPDGAGRRLLDKLTHVYLRDWINSQSDDVKRGEPGAEARLAAAETLKREFEKILEGEPPYDLFVRWKPLHEQPIGWEPDINDGVRINIRPFMMAADVSRKGAGILRFKPNIKWGPKADKGKDLKSLRAREDFPWFWGWDGSTQDFAGGDEFDGNRWNDLHYTNAFKQAARDRAAKREATA